MLAYDFTFRRFPMQLHIRPRSTALHDERFVCVAHHAMLRRTQCQAVMVIGQDASCNDRKREKDELGGAITLVNSSLIATAAAQLATRLKCKLKTCFPSLGQDDSLPACQLPRVFPPFFPPAFHLHLHNATNSSKSNNYLTPTHHPVAFTVKRSFCQTQRTHQKFAPTLHNTQQTTKLSEN